jgi:hypothetical protein
MILLKMIAIIITAIAIIVIIGIIKAKRQGINNL